MSYETLIVDQSGSIGTITLNRPDARNALDFAMRRELLMALDEIEANPAARVVILTGAGGHFCAGGDVKNMRQRTTAADGQVRVGLLNRAVLRLVNFPLPTIAMVDGYAVGAGSNLALCCDLIVASDRAKFGELFCKIGLAVDGGGTWLLPRLVGMARAKELVFTGDIFDAAEALRIGLVNRVVHVGRSGLDDPRARREDRRGPAAGAAARQAGAEPGGQQRSGRGPRGRGALARPRRGVRRSSGGRRRVLREAPAEVLGHVTRVELAARRFDGSAGADRRCIDCCGGGAGRGGTVVLGRRGARRSASSRSGVARRISLVILAASTAVPTTRGVISEQELRLLDEPLGELEEITE